MHYIYFKSQNRNFIFAIWTKVKLQKYRLRIIYEVISNLILN